MTGKHLIDAEVKERESIRRITDNLVEYADGQPPAEIEQVVREKHEQYANAPVREFVPIFVERAAREALGQPGPARMDV